MSYFDDNEDRILHGRGPFAHAPRGQRKRKSQLSKDQMTTEKQKVTITVAGPYGSGKSTLMALIADAITASGVSVVQELVSGEPLVVGALRKRRLAALKDKIEVEIVEKQLPR